MEDRKSALLERWRKLEVEEFSKDESPNEESEFRKRKEEWFSDAFTFLINFEENFHIWCDHEDVMWPLLEPFCSYFDYEESDCPLKALWNRISRELQMCTECIIRHHKAQELYRSEFEEEAIRPLLMVLQSLDEERIANHLKDINRKAWMKELDVQKNYFVVIGVLFEVLMHPHLLDDREVANEFVPFVIQVEKFHDLRFSENQQYPGVYALMFLEKSEARALGFRLAGYFGKIRRASELQSVQPLIKKCIYFLDHSSPREDSRRPRVQYEREAVWSGIKSLIGFLEPSAFEEGIVERYPIFLSMVLNQVSDDSAKDFMHAVDCLKLLFEKLGCKLWLRTTFSPSVMRNTLLGQCFHTRIERHHKAIFDLFQPFLQSLEALQDGEFERQRRHFLYFLLHQVTHSNNFSLLMKKKACQIAILIVARGYKMDPPCPPFECVHMWAPSLIKALKDRSLFDPFRQPAFELIQTIIVADAAALASLWKRDQICDFSTKEFPIEVDEDEEELQTLNEIEEANSSCWDGFDIICKLISKSCQDWFCIPLLWMDVLTGISPSTLPLSISKSVMWSLSRLSSIRPESSSLVLLDISEYLQKIHTSDCWDTPKGCDDGADGKGSINSVRASSYSLDLIRLMRRCGANYVKKIEESELFKQWTWEPRMGEAIILLLLDTDDIVRQSGKVLLEHVSGTQGLHSGLQFLCSSQTSISAMLFGLRHAVKMLLSGSLLPNFPALQHFFFVTLKLVSPYQELVGKEYTRCNEHFSKQGILDGGFLRPALNLASLTTSISRDVSNEQSEEIIKKFQWQLSDYMWPLIPRCLSEGKAFVQEKSYQMTFVRLFEILPKLVGHCISSHYTESQFCGSTCHFAISMRKAAGFRWLYDLVEWGKSQLIVVSSHWKQAFIATLKNLKVLSNRESDEIMTNILQRLVSGTITIDWLQEQVSLLSLALFQSPASNAQTQKGSCPVDVFDNSENRAYLHQSAHAHHSGIHALKQDSKLEGNTSAHNVIILSDDELETQSEKSNIVKVDEEVEVRHLYSQSENSPLAEAQASVLDHTMQSISKDNPNLNKNSSIASVVLSHGASNMPAATQSQFECKPSSGRSGIFSHKGPVHMGISEAPQQKAMSPINSQREEDENKTKSVKESTSLQNFRDKSLVETTRDCVKVGEQESVSKAPSKTTKNSVSSHVLKSAVSNPRKELQSLFNDDPLETALDASKKVLTIPVKQVSLPKRQLIHLQVPPEIKKGEHYRLHPEAKIYKPPRLDDWYKRILELNYFLTVGISLPESEAENLQVEDLSKLPTSFMSPENYIDVFRPLVLEEFKAQLRHSFEEIGSPEDMCCGKARVLSLERVDDFQIVRFMPDAGEDAACKGCLENDLVLLSRQPFQTISQNIHMIAKVDRRERDAKSRCVILVLRLYINPSIVRLTKAKRMLTERSKWCLTRLMSITPQLREFQALSSIRDNPLLPVIINPHRSALESFESSNLSEREYMMQLPEALNGRLKVEYNESQRKAINAVIAKFTLKNSCQLSLIQGPPGTGKTRTILAIVSSILALSNKGFGLASSHMMKNTTTYASKEFGKYRPQRARVLICAQSNAAVDELVLRIYKCGLYDRNGLIYKPYIVRVGNSKQVHPDVLPVFIDNLVDERLGEKRQSDADSRDEKAHSHTSELRLKLEKLVEMIKLYEAQRSAHQEDRLCSSSNENNMGCRTRDTSLTSEAVLRMKLNNLYRQKREISTELAVAEDDEKKSFQENKALRQDLRRDIIREAEIVVTTLSGCGGDIFYACLQAMSGSKCRMSGDALFDAVVIDEAAQALEPATLIPMQLLKPIHGLCVMVGDPKQLPATVLSQIATKYSYQCSMFERLQRAGFPVTMLSTQYRMHPEICRFPSAHFYENQLKDATAMTVERTARFHESFYLRPFVFYDVQDGCEESGVSVRSQSLRNESEAIVTLEILKFLKQRYPQEFYPDRIGIVTPYKQQLRELRSWINDGLGSSIAGDIEFNTVDGFQGREVDIVIFSTVRASISAIDQPDLKFYGIGFVADVRRMNVALTRAKFSLWIVGNAKTLCRSSHWAALLDNAKERNSIMRITRPYKYIFSSHDSGRTSRHSSRTTYDSDRMYTVHGKPDTNPLGALKGEEKTSQSKRQTLKERSRKRVAEPTIEVERTKEKDHFKKCQLKESNQISSRSLAIASSAASIVNAKYNSKETSFSIEEKQMRIKHSHGKEPKKCLEGNPSNAIKIESQKCSTGKKHQVEDVNAVRPSGALVSYKKPNISGASCQVTNTAVGSSLTKDTEKQERISNQSEERTSSKGEVTPEPDKLTIEWERFKRMLEESKLASESKKSSPQK